MFHACTHSHKKVPSSFFIIILLAFYDIIYFVISPEAVNGEDNYKEINIKKFLWFYMAPLPFDSNQRLWNYVSWATACVFGTASVNLRENISSHSSKNTCRSSWLWYLSNPIHNSRNVPQEKFLGTFLVTFVPPILLPFLPPPFHGCVHYHICSHITA